MSSYLGQAIRVRGARQNNLKNLDLDIPLNEIVVVTGVSGSGKSSLVFDTIYAEGQRRYVETFSPYARQFLDRMDRPQVDRIEGIPPAIAIDQTNPVRTSRSTVGTMTELADHLKLLYARAARLHCRQCGQLVQRDNPQSIAAQLHASLPADARVVLTFPVEVPDKLPEAELLQLLAAQGYTRVHARREHAGKVTLDITQDRLRWGQAEPARLDEALESALRASKGRVDAQVTYSAPPSVAGGGGEGSLFAAQRTASAPPPLAGGGWEGVEARTQLPASDTPPQPSPTSGEGAVRRTPASGDDNADFAQRTASAPPPLAGGGGEGVSVVTELPASDTPPQPSPARGEGDADTPPQPSPASGEGAMVRALASGEGNADVASLPPAPEAHATTLRFSTDLHCARCDIHYKDPSPSAFSFNNPVGACDVCRGFGRVVGIDYGLVIPDDRKSLQQGCIKPWQTASFKECQADLLKFAIRDGIPTATPWRDMAPEHRAWVMDGQAKFKTWERDWYGMKRFFDWLESRTYKMHVRVLLSKYRSYTPCSACGGARLKPESLLWRVGSVGERGVNLHELNSLPITQARRFFDGLHLGTMLDAATELLLGEVKARLQYLCDVGLGYLTLDRQGRTLSGGEVQRINLCTALGTSLTNTLFVLDEPSIGLHPRDVGRLNQVMQRLKAGGNSLLVVEHDPQVMRTADRMLEIGPGPGERGGSIVQYDTFSSGEKADTLTGKYLRGELRVDAGLTRRVLRRSPDGALLAPRLIIEGAREHNLRNVTVAVPLDCLVAITGVSGSGKSSLISDVLYPALAKAKGRGVEHLGACDRVLGDDQIADVVLVDQSPLGKSARSNPVSFVGAFDGIRARFAATAEARARGYTAGTFSFNAGDGRCPTCGGTGFQHVEMQFLSDVYLRCPDCDGKRFRAEVLEVKVDARDRALSVSDVLDLTVHEALALFAGDADVTRPLRALVDVGLDYLKLGQPTPTLSGGEAQRLKLAGFLATAYAQDGKRRGATKGQLFLFDEPTTGLHFDDIAKLLRSLRRLIDAGHSVVVIEHNLDVIRAADWIVDLGPEGGDAGGSVVAQGTPDEVMQVAASYTGRALRDDAAHQQRVGQSQPDMPEGDTLTLQGATDAHGGRSDAVPQGALQAAESTAPYLAHAARGGRRGFVSIVNAREHNLKNIRVDIPHGQFTVITGVSGSGKSTLAFDVLFNEGQRRYLESLNAYARQFVQPAAKPDVDAIYGIPPTVAIEQRTSRGGRKSTVATLTEVYHFVRLIYAKLGTQFCPACDVAIAPQSEDAIVAALMKQQRGRHIGVLAPLVIQRKGYYTDLAAWARNRGHTHLRVDGEFLPTSPWPRLDRFKEHTLELPVGDLVLTPAAEPRLRELVKAALAQGRGVLHVLPDVDEAVARSLRAQPSGAPLPDTVQVFSTKRACPSCGTSFREPDPRLFSYNSPVGWCTGCFGTGLKLAGFDAEQTGEEGAWAAAEATVCSACEGRRLNPVALNVRFRGQSIAQVAALTVDDAVHAVAQWQLAPDEAAIARDALAEIGGRLAFLQRVGLGYLSLDRAAPTLSGGEAQRIRLAAQLGSNLQGVCYVLDEPTIGLHPRDNRILLDALDELQKKGNTLVVVEHDDDTIRRADHLIDIGPGAGKRGGHIIAQGTLQQVMQESASITARYLREPLRHPFITHRSTDAHTPAIELAHATLNNLRDASARFPLQRLTVVTGVSGSGKSTLARDVLLAQMRALVAAANSRGAKARSAHAAASLQPAQLSHWQAVERVLEVDQTPIGKTPRSCPATYVGVWDDIRKLMAEMSEAKMRGYSASRFSFNTGEGRCPACEGAGAIRIAMNFLPDVEVPCDVCRGLRFNRETLEVKLRGKSAGDILAMDVDEAVEFFAAHRKIHHALKLMQDVGLGYLQLGQPSPFLSGGEAQRIKLVTELATAGARPTLYVLDEPTVGLHMADVDKLIRVLHRLVDAGHTVVTIEHNLDVMAEADWIVDMGPEGGAGGGRVVLQGPVSAFMAPHAPGHTAQVLQRFLQQPLAA